MVFRLAYKYCGLERTRNTRLEREKAKLTEQRLVVVRFRFEQR